MARVDRFEDLVAWQRARVLTQDVYAATSTGRLSADRGLSGQLQRAAVSVMANLAEGFERTGFVEFHRFVAIAKASCAEVRSLLYVALDAQYLDQPVFDQLMEQANEVARLTGALRASLARSTKRKG